MPRPKLAWFGFRALRGRRMRRPYHMVRVSGRRGSVSQEILKPCRGEACLTRNWHGSDSRRCAGDACVAPTTWLGFPGGRGRVSQEILKPCRGEACLARGFLSLELWFQQKFGLYIFLIRNRGEATEITRSNRRDQKSHDRQCRCPVHSQTEIHQIG